MTTPALFAPILFEAPAPLGGAAQVNVNGTCVAIPPKTTSNTPPNSINNVSRLSFNS
jgi:hypothetical protein